MWHLRMRLSDEHDGSGLMLELNGLRGLLQIYDSNPRGIYYPIHAKGHGFT